MPRGRPKKQTTIDAERQKVIARLEQIATEGAPAAMETLVRAASGEKVPREVIAAAQYLLDQVLGRPSQKVEADPTEDQVVSIVKRIRELRQHDKNVGSELGGTDLLVEGASDGVHPVEGTEGNPTPSS